MANWISLIRVLLGFAVFAILALPSPGAYVFAFVLTLIVIWMDGLDGYVARKFNEASKFGSVFDILCDRAVELTYWIGFCAFGWVPLWMPLMVMARGVFVDGFRAIALEQGHTAFGENSMMKSNLGVFLVSSRFSRFSYAILKALAFSVTILAFMPGGFSARAWVMPLAWLSLYGTVIFCVIRGLPVLIEARRFFIEE